MESQRKKPGRKKGTVKTGGRVKGRKNRKTLERERLARQAAAEILGQGLKTKVPKKVQEQIVKEVQADQTGQLKLGKQILSEFANVLAGMAALVQPRSAEEIRGKSSTFRDYARLAVYSAEKAAQYESPRLAAMMIGQAQTRKIDVSGGLPARDEVPMLTNEQYVEAMKGVGPEPAPLDATPAPAPAKEPVGSSSE